MSSIVNIRNPTNCGRHKPRVFPSYKKFGVGQSGLDYCSRIQAPGSASLVYDSFLWSQESGCASRKSKGGRDFFLSTWNVNSAYILLVRTRSHDHPKLQGKLGSSLFILYTLFNLRTLVLLLKTKWSENWEVWPVPKEVQVVISHWVCFCPAVLLLTTGPPQGWSCHCSSSLFRPWGSHAWFSRSSYSGYTRRHSQWVWLNCKFSGQEAGSSRASCLSYNLCQIWLLCDSGDPSFESRLPIEYCFLTGRPQTISPQAMSDSAEHFNGGNQNLNAFPTGGSWPLCKSIYFLPRSALNTRIIDRAHLH